MEASARGGQVRQKMEAPQCLMDHAVDRKPPRMVARTGVGREAVKVGRCHGVQ